MTKGAVIGALSPDPALGRLGSTLRTGCDIHGLRPHDGSPLAGTGVPTGSGRTVLDSDDLPATSAPPAVHRFHLLVEHLGVFDLEVATEGVMVKCPGPAACGDVEPGDVSAGGASVPGVAHGGDRTVGPGGCLPSNRRSWFDASVDQRCFDDLGTALHEVTFCVVDLETTGTSPGRDRITEVGAVKLRGGACIGTLQTLVNPGCAIPPTITVLTGITEAMVLPAPTIDQVLPSLLEFIGDAVLVGHNVRFDIGFLDAALERTGRDRLTNRRVDTCSLARRLVRNEVPDCKLGTLARRFALPNRPSHRALDDALATGDLLHILLERAAGLGVTGLDDLLALPTMAGHAQAAKLPLTAGLPRGPGVYLFGGAGDDVLYVGKATNMRSRVRSYFSGDDRRKVGALLRQTQRIDHLSCAHPLEAEVREIRLLQTLTPRYNRQAVDPGRYRYVRLSPGSSPRLVVTRVADPDAGIHLGPMGSTSAARRVVDAAAAVCPDLLTPSRRDGPWLPDWATSGEMTGPDEVAEAFAGAPGVLLERLGRVMATLASREEFELAAALRDRAAALSAAAAEHHRLGWLRRSPRLALEVDGMGGIELRHGVVVATWGPDGQVGALDTPLSPFAAEESTAPDGGPVPRWLADEVRAVARWVDRHASRVRILAGDASPASPWPAPPRFRAAETGTRRTAVAA
jgi:DNA polymerase III subunit epsilon